MSWAYHKLMEVVSIPEKSRESALISLLLLFLLSSPGGWSMPLPSHRRPFRIVIDPGHGGSDYGTIYRKGRIQVAEKDVTLRIAKRVAEKLRAHGMVVILTRDSDEDLPVPERTAFANRLKADVFLSIHMNSTPRPGSGEGIETYILNHATDAAARRLSQLENRGIAPRNTESKPMPAEVALILQDLRLDANLPESKRLACSIQKRLVTAEATRTHVVDRGVKQALFYVLLGANMPSALVEAGFLSSDQDRRYVLSAEGQQAVSGAIASAIENFRHFKGTPIAESTLSSCQVH